MTENTAQAKQKRTPKIATTPNPELAAKYKDVFARQRQHSTTHDGCDDKTCADAKALRLELKALDGESKKLSAIAEAAEKAGLLEATEKAAEAVANGVEAPKKVRVKKPTAEQATPAQRAKVEKALSTALGTEEQAQPLAIEVEAPKAKAKRAPKPTQAVTPVAEEPKPEKAPKAPPAPTDFLMYVGGAFYTKEAFIKEAQEMGVSKRLPTFRIPPDMVVGKSRIWLAAGGERKAGEKGKTDLPTEAHSHIFGYFTPDAIEFIAGEDGDKTYADIIGYLKNIDGVKIVEGNPEVVFKKRLCGMRKVGGTYLTTKEGKGKKSPITLLDAELPYLGNHFRGLMRLDAEAAAKLDAGEGLTTLVQDQCMVCDAEVLVAPDSRKRAAVERRRMDRGEDPKWKLECAECKKARREEERKAKEAAAVEAAPEAVEEVAEEGDAPAAAEE